MCTVKAVAHMLHDVPDLPHATLCLQTVRLYDAAQAKPLATLSQSAPVLDVAFPDDSTIYSAALDGTVTRCGAWVACH